MPEGSRRRHPRLKVAPVGTQSYDLETMRHATDVRRKNIEAKRLQLLRLWADPEQRIPLETMGRRLGVSGGTISKWLKQAGLK